MVRPLFFLVALVCFGSAAYDRFLVHNSYSSYSDAQLDTLTNEMDAVAQAGGDSADEARISRTLLEDERRRRQIFWVLLGVGAGAAALGVLFRPRRSASTREEDARLLTYLA